MSTRRAGCHARQPRVRVPAPPACMNWLHASVCFVPRRVVRNGAMYGVDWLLYDGSPGQVHAELAVVVPSRAHPVLPVQLVALCRLAESIAKTVVIVTVSMAADAMDPFLAACTARLAAVTASHWKADVVAERRKSARGGGGVTRSR